MKKSSFLTVFLFFVVCTCLQAAQIGSWRVYPSYHNAQKSVAMGKTIYTVANGDLFSYNTEDTEVRTYDNLDVLNDVDIVDIGYIGYSQEAKKIILIYSNSNIDLLDAYDNVQNLSALKDKSIVGKEITDMCIYGSMAYLSTGFGFVEVDMKEGVFRNTYRLGFETKSVAVNADYIYLATTAGLFRCPKTDNMQDVANWKKHQEFVDWKRLLFHGDQLVGVRYDFLYQINPQKANNIELVCKDKSTVGFLCETNNQLFWGKSDTIRYASTLPDYSIIKEDNTWSDVTYLDGIYWVSDQYKGLQGYKLTDGQLQVTVSSIIPNKQPCA